MQYDFSRIWLVSIGNNYALYQFISLTKKIQNIKNIDRLFVVLRRIGRSLDI